MMPICFAVVDDLEVADVAVVDDLAVVGAGRIDAGKNLHQGRFAGAVFADQCVDLTLREP